jgi:hypothetical protein
MKLKAVPTRPEFFEQYLAWCVARGVQFRKVVMRATFWLWVEGPSGLVLGCPVFESGAFLMADFLVVSSGASAVEAHNAVSLVVDELVILATAKDLVPLGHTSSSGMARLLRRKGFAAGRDTVFVREPGMTARRVLPRKPRPSKPASVPQKPASVPREPAPKKRRAARRAKKNV